MDGEVREPVASHSSIATLSYVWPSAAVTGFLRRPACFYGQPCAEVCGFNFPKVFTENPARFFHIDVDLLLCYNSPWATLARDAEEGDAPHGHLSLMRLSGHRLWAPRRSRAANQLSVLRAWTSASAQVTRHAASANLCSAKNPYRVLDWLA